jgi:hypothetical protein
MISSSLMSADRSGLAKWIESAFHWLTQGHYVVDSDRAKVFPASSLDVDTRDAQMPRVVCVGKFCNRFFECETNETVNHVTDTYERRASCECTVLILADDACGE